MRLLHRNKHGGRGGRVAGTVTADDEEALTGSVDDSTEKDDLSRGGSLALERLNEGGIDRTVGRRRCRRIDHGQSRSNQARRRGKKTRSQTDGTPCGQIGIDAECE